MDVTGRATQEAKARAGVRIECSSNQKPPSQPTLKHSWVNPIIVKTYRYVSYKRFQL